MRKKQKPVDPDPMSSTLEEQHEGRIIRLEEFRTSHEHEHENHVATQAWVYRVGFGVLVATVGLASGIVVLVARLLSGL